MKRIAYIELDTHAEIAANFRELMQDSPEYSVDYYYSEKVLNLLGLEAGGTVFKTGPDDIFRQISEGSYDLVIVGTVHRYFKVFRKITASFNSAVVVHNQNFSRSSPWQLFKNIFKHDVAYRCKLLLKEGLLQAPSVYRSAKFRLVLDEDLVKHDLKFLPVFYTAHAHWHRKRTYTIIIPGTVSQNRRDYRHVFRKIQAFSGHPIFKFVLLGKASGDLKKEIKGMINVKQNPFELQIFDRKIAAQEFESWMKMADVLWCPIRNRTSFFDVPEVYGLTKMSGNIGDAIRYSKMAIFPAWFQSSKDFVVAEHQDIEGQLLSLSQSSPTGFSNYSQNNVQDLLHKALDEMTAGA